MKVLISDNLAPIGEKILREAGLEVDVKTGLPPLISPQPVRRV